MDPPRTPPGVIAGLPFEGVARQLVLALKFRHRRAAAAMLVPYVLRRLPLDHFDLVTWAPTSARRVRRRGYDQAELIARAVARQLGVPCRRLLYRSHAAPQAGKSRPERLVGPSFRARQARPGLHVLVVDDVVTTGGTLRAAHQALRAAGVSRVTLTAAVSADRHVTPDGMRRPLACSPVGFHPAWESSIASSAPVKARS